ncbi:MAG: arginase family protein [Brevinema sp.]
MTLRLILPQWQGGINPNYAFGSELLAFIAPPNATDKTMRVSVNMDFSNLTPPKQGIYAEEILLSQLDETTNILNNESPDKVVVFGGDCSISQAPFDYLSGKYGEKLGVLWLDAHPDISTTDTSRRYHEMVLANLIGYGDSSLARRVNNQIDKKRVLFAGLIKEDLRGYEATSLDNLNIPIVSPEELKINSHSLTKWINENNITKLAVHFDLDVLDRADFRSNTCAKPHMSKEEFGAAMGELSLNQIVKILGDVSNSAEIVGLSIAEHMPWDAINLRKALSHISIFNG